MDPERIHAYLQAACAGLGFDIGEVWRITGRGATSKPADSGIIPGSLPLNTHIEFFPPSSASSTSSSSTTSTAVADPTHHHGNGIVSLQNGNHKKLLRFVQLHTSLSYNDKRSKLVCPTTGVTLENHDYPDPEEDADNVSKHVLSPSLINAVSSTRAEIIWANNHDRDGLLGRSDMRLQTAVGMPVAVDNDGNMCVVVMFSPNDIKSNDDSLEYLNFISRSATSFSIPCLLPVIKDPSKIFQFADQDDDDVDMNMNMNMGNEYNHGCGANEHDHFNSFDDDDIYMSGKIIEPRSTSALKLNTKQLAMQETDLGRRGITTRLFSFRSGGDNDGIAAVSVRRKLNDDKTMTGSEPEVHIVHDISTEPRDSFGIPMLPTEGYAFHYDMELSGDVDDNSIFDGTVDEASYGVWSTIMRNDVNAVSNHGDEGGVVSLMNGNDTSMDGKNSVLPQRISSDSSLNLLAQATSLYELSANEDSLFSSDEVGETNNIHGEVDESRLAKADDVWKITKGKKLRLEEFAQAFLGMSVFDIADIWMPGEIVENDMLLKHVSSMTNDHKNEDFVAFRQFSSTASVKMWSGAVGRAFASGNPVWSRNEKMIVDSNRAHAFHQAQIKSVLSVPVIPAGCKTPVCVVTCYSQSRVNCNPNVLRFVQQAVRLLWVGFDSVTPHSSVGDTAWKEVAPEDVGKMAADADLHQVFLKKRPFCEVSAFSEEHKSKRGGSREDMSQQQATMTIIQDPPAAKPQQAETKVEEPKKSSISGVEAMSNDFVRLKLPIGSGSLLNNPKVKPKLAPLKSAIQISSFVAPNTKKKCEVIKVEPTSTPVPAPLAPQNITNSMLPPGLAMPPMGALSWMHCMPTNSSIPPAPVKIGTAMTDAVNFSQAARNNVNFPLQFQQLACTFTDYSQQQNRDNPNINAAAVAAAAAGLNMNSMLYMPTLNTMSMQQMEALNASTNKQLGASSFPATLSLNRPLDQKICRIQGCEDSVIGRKPYCVKHSGVRNCEFVGCKKCAQGATRFCIAHGGGRRCTFPGCNKGARDKYFCAGHGGGKRCSNDGCSKSAVGGSDLCTSHGGGRRCTVEGCSKSAQASTKFCVKHGGGKRCSADGCTKVARGRTKFCAGHGGGTRCKIEGCGRVAVGKLMLCRGHTQFSNTFSLG